MFVCFYILPSLFDFLYYVLMTTVTVKDDTFFPCPEILGVLSTKSFFRKEKLYSGTQFAHQGDTATGGNTVCSTGTTFSFREKVSTQVANVGPFYANEVSKLCNSDWFV